MSFGFTQRDAQYENASFDSAVVRKTLTTNLLEARYLNDVNVEDLIATVEGDGAGQDVQFDRIFTVVPGDDVQAAIDAALVVAIDRAQPQVVFLGPGEYPDTALILKAGVVLVGWVGINNVLPSFNNLATLVISNQNTGSFDSVVVQNAHFNSTAAPTTLSDNSMIEFTMMNSRIDTAAAAGMSTTQIVAFTMNHSEIGISFNNGVGITLGGAGPLTVDIKNNSSIFGVPAFLADAQTGTVAHSSVRLGNAAWEFASATSSAFRIEHCRIEATMNGDDSIILLGGNDVLTIAHTQFPTVSGMTNWVDGTGTVTYGPIFTHAATVGIGGGLTATALANSP